VHTIAFYSHRGGVERTRALANVAVELVRRGRKVLVVDFDLEAPTLDTLGLFQSADEAKFGLAQDSLEMTIDLCEGGSEYTLDSLGETLWLIESTGWAELTRARDSLLMAKKEIQSSDEDEGRFQRAYAILEKAEKSLQLVAEGPLHPGLLEYVTAFRRTGQEPDVLDYLYEAPLAAVAAPGKSEHQIDYIAAAARAGAEGRAAAVGMPVEIKRDEAPRTPGKLWVMPAGRWNRRWYRRALARLDWMKLYKKGGFEFFKRTKARWQEGLNPDHVLLDCPRGWTSVEGVCTRQLADAVVVLCPVGDTRRDSLSFGRDGIVPLELGLGEIPGTISKPRPEPELSRTVSLLKDVETETDRGRPTKIAIHFVWYDLPADADPDTWLRRPLPHKNLEPAAALPQEPATLYEDAIVVRTKPDSAAARQYRLLTDAILIGDPKDREGAQLFLERMKQTYAKGVVGYELEEEERRLDAIQGHFLDEPDILLRAGECLLTGGRFRFAISHLDRVLELRPGWPEALYSRALCHHRLGDRKAARKDLLDFLARSDITHTDSERGLRELYVLAPEVFEAIRCQLESRRLSSREQRELSAQFVYGGLPYWLLALPPLERVKLQILLEAEAKPRTDIRPLIREGRFGEACQALAPRGRDLREKDLEDLIDLAMAHWGLDSELPEDVCAAIRDRDARRAPEERRNPTYGQVIALALWRLEEREEARKRLDEARQEAAHRFSGEGGPGRPTRCLPSCWRYTEVTFEQFADDCDQIRGLIDGAPIRPPFMDRPPRT
jgi:tetratricopeptide (TPR) repeat protein